MARVVNQKIIDHVICLSLEAGQAILEIYESPEKITVATKEDDSPVTQADLVAHRILVEGLSRVLPDVPIVSEEGELASFEQRQQWQHYWLIDPLDGTKEFIGRNGDFTVNIALVENGIPVFGVVVVPVSGVCYWGMQGLGAFKESHGKRQAIHTRDIDAESSVTVVASRHHGVDALKTLKEVLAHHFKSVGYQSRGSSLKLCLIAEGNADIYPRFAPTCEWDIAAAQAIVKSAGGCVVDLQFTPVSYNHKETMLNPYFYVLGDPNYPWQALLDKINPE